MLLASTARTSDKLTASRHGRAMRELIKQIAIPTTVPRTHNIDHRLYQRAAKRE
jgi:hypothetical protein